VNKLDLLFDSKQFEVAFGEAIGESSSAFKVCRPDASAHSKGESASVGAGLSRDGGQNVVHAAGRGPCVSFAGPSTASSCFAAICNGRHAVSC
jgi:hypothetical protein